MTDSAKLQILNKLRLAQPRTNAQPWQPSSASDVKTPDVERFKLLLQQNHSEVHEIAEDQLNASFNDWLATENLNGATVIADHPALKDLKPQLTKDLRLIELGALDKNKLFSSVTLSVCYADAGIASKGTLIVKASAHQPRTLSLVPQINMLIIKKSNILKDLDDAFGSAHFVSENLPSNIVLISGPSKTADIQQTLAYGAHGPKRLIVFLLT